MIKKSIKTYDFTTKPTITLHGGYRVTGYSTITSGNNNNITIGQYLTTTTGTPVWSTNNTNRITTFTGEVRYPGAIMYNSELNRLERWTGSDWVPVVVL